MAKKAINGTLFFTKDSPYYKAGEKKRELTNITEIHYGYKPSALDIHSTAFESKIEGTGFTVETRWIEEFEVFAK